MHRSKPSMERAAAGPVETEPPVPVAVRFPFAAPEAERGLIARAQGGDEAAFRSLIELHKDRAYGLALRIVRSSPDAEEVAQDAFVRAWLALPRFRGESRFSTWLHRIVARLALDRAARLRWRGVREQAFENVEEAGTAVIDSVGASSRARALEHLVEQLSETQRAAITLFYYEDRSVEQVAATLGIPTGTVKTHLSRARAALREAWLKETGEHPR